MRRGYYFKLIYKILFLLCFTLFFTLVKHPVAVYAQCSGAGCSQFNCSLPGFESDSPCTRNGGCCYPQGDGSYACRDPLVATPNPGSICAAPTTPTQPNTNTPTVPSNPPTAPPIQTNTTTPGTTTTAPTQPNCLVGYDVSGGPGQGCNTPALCTCPSGRLDCPYGTPGYCREGTSLVVCAMNQESTAGCNTNLDCQRYCGGGSNYYCTANHRCSGGRPTGDIAPCVGAGMTCITASACNNGTTACGYNNGLRCETAGTICCVQSACTTPPPVEAGERFAYVECANNGIKTGLGCIPTDPAAFIRQILTIGIGLGGGIAFLLILLGGFKVIMSQGNPEAMSEGRDLITSAIAGLMLIIFSVFILRFIGVNILGLPGFG